MCHERCQIFVTSESAELALPGNDAVAIDTFRRPRRYERMTSARSSSDSGLMRWQSNIRSSI